MLFMSTYTFEPGQSDEIMMRRLQRGALAPEGVKVIGEWFYVGGHKGFILFDTNNPSVLMKMALGWTDLVRFETIPVMETEEVLNLAKSAK